MTMNNWPTATDLVYGNNSTLSGWLLDLNLVIPGGINIRSQENQLYYDSILGSVSAKAETGMCVSAVNSLVSSFTRMRSNISVADPWSRMISYHFLNQTDYANFFTNDSPHGAGQLWSDMPNLPAYEQALAPFPLVVFDSKPAGLNTTNPLPLEPVVYEVSVAVTMTSNSTKSLLLKMSPLEFGSYDPQLSAMANASYAGTSLLNGQPANGSSCVTGFDEAGFVMGTSSNLFNVSQP
jgi:lysophospholipase